MKEKIKMKKLCLTLLALAGFVLIGGLGTPDSGITAEYHGDA